MTKTHLPLRQQRNAPGGVQLTLCGRAVDCENTPYLPRSMVGVTCSQCRMAAASLMLANWLFTPESDAPVKHQKTVSRNDRST